MYSMCARGAGENIYSAIRHKAKEDVAEAAHHDPGDATDAHRETARLGRRGRASGARWRGHPKALPRLPLGRSSDVPPSVSRRLCRVTVG